MNLQRNRLALSFCLCLTLTVFSAALLPQCKLLFFAPYMVNVFYQRPLLKTLWIALACGLVIDLFCSSQRLPLHALTFVVTSALLYPQRRHFFADTLSTLPMMTFFFSSLFTLLYFFLVNVYVSKMAVTLEWMFTDLIAMPALDALFAFILFQLPLLLVGKRPMKGEDYFSS